MKPYVHRPRLAADSGNPLSRDLYQRRTIAGLRLRELADLVDVNAGHLSRVEQGKRPPTMALAEALDVALGAGGALVALAQQVRDGDTENDGNGHPAALHAIDSTMAALGRLRDSLLKEIGLVEVTA